MDAVEVKFSDWIQKGFDLYKENFGLLAIAALIAVIISAATVGILAGPMMAGLALLALNLYDRTEPRPQIGDLFRGFSYFIPSLLFILVWGIITLVISTILNVIPILGQLLSLFFIYAIQALLMFAIFLIVEKDMAFWPASMASINKVKTNFWPFFGLGLVAGIIGSVGAILLGIGDFLTLPLQVTIITAAYRDVFDRVEAL